MTDVNVPTSRSTQRKVISAKTYWPLVKAVYGDEDACLWCGCGFDDHSWSVQRTHWYEPYEATKQKQRAVWRLSDGTLAIKRTTRRAQVQAIWCYGCARRLRTDQVVCYKRPQLEAERASL